MRNVIFTCDCREHNKIINRSVWLMDYTIENLRSLWEKSKNHRILFSDDINGDFQTFISLFLFNDLEGNIQTNGLLWVVDDFVGVLFMSEISRREALLHFSFFDGRLRLDISMEMIKYIFDNYKFNRLNAEIVPFASKRVFNFVEQIGFVREGKKRHAMVYKGGQFDLLLYGLLREEFEEKWDTRKEQLVEDQQED